MFVTSTSAPARSRSSTSRPRSDPRSSTTARLPRLSSSKTALTSSGPPPSMRWNCRAGSPEGGSTLTTSAPQSARIPAAPGPATHTPSSTTRIPSSGPVIDAPSFGWRHHDHGALLVRFPPPRARSRRSRGPERGRDLEAQRPVPSVAGGDVVHRPPLGHPPAPRRVPEAHAARVHPALLRGDAEDPEHLLLGQEAEDGGE